MLSQSFPPTLMISFVLEDEGVDSALIMFIRMANDVKSSSYTRPSVVALF
jgi:hypothetical protein